MRVNKTLRGEDTSEIEKNALSKNIDFFTQYLFHKIVYYYEDVCGSFNDLYYDQCIFLTAFFVYLVNIHTMELVIAVGALAISFLIIDSVTYSTSSAHLRVPLYL